MMKIQNDDLDNLLKQYGLDRLDEDDQTTVLRMLQQNDDYKKKEKLFTKLETNYLAGSYTQNYLILKQLLNIQEQNNKTIEQNQQIIEQNNKTVEQNQQIIDLLTEIKSK